MDEVDRIIKEAEEIPVTVITPTKGAALAGLLIPFGLALLFGFSQLGGRL